MCVCVCARAVLFLRAFQSNQSPKPSESAVTLMPMPKNGHQKFLATCGDEWETSFKLIRYSPAKLVKEGLLFAYVQSQCTLNRKPMTKRLLELRVASPCSAPMRCRISL